MPKIIGTPAVRFNIQSRTDDDSYVILVFRYKCGPKNVRLKYSPGIVVKNIHWSQEAQRVTTKHPDRLNVNRQLDELDAIVLSIWRTTKGNISVSEFRDEIQYRTGEKQRPQDDAFAPTNLLDFGRAWLEERKAAKDGKRGTWKNLNTHFAHLEAFADDTGHDLEFDGIDYNFFHALKDWLYSAPRSLSKNYVAKQFDLFRQFMNEAGQRNYHSNLVFKNFTVQKEKIQKIALSFDELDKLYSLDLSDDPRLEKVRDLLVIGSYTGLRFSDFTRITPDHISVEDDGTKILTITTVKTGGTVSIPLFEQAETLLQKYGGKAPSISNQKMNDYLKELCEKAGIDEPVTITRTIGGRRREETLPKYKLITTHVARRSFATNFFRLGVPAATLMQITGHASERQFMQYIAIEGKKNAQEFAKEAAMRMGKRYLRKVSGD